MVEVISSFAFCVLSRDSVIPDIGRIQSNGADCKLDMKFHPPSARIQNQLMDNISNRTFGEMKVGCRSHEDWASLQAFSLVLACYLAEDKYAAENFETDTLNDTYFACH